MYVHGIANISADDWEFFAADFLTWLGFNVIIPPAKGIDGGKDLIVLKENQRYLVSCKHYFQSGKMVGIEDENQFIERLAQHHCDHFIGFYSTGITSSLQSRFIEIQANPNYNHIQFIILDRLMISNSLPNIRTEILQKYGLPQHSGFMLHVDKNEYIPLKCISCDKDILAEENITSSMATMWVDKNTLYFVHGCKKCLEPYSHLEKYGWICMSQAIHHEQLLGWGRIVYEALNAGHIVDKTFSLHKFNFDHCVQQRIYPVGWGTWLGGYLS